MTEEFTGDYSSPANSLLPRELKELIHIVAFASMTKKYLFSPGLEVPHDIPFLRTRDARPLRLLGAKS